MDDVQALERVLQVAEYVGRVRIVRTPERFAVHDVTIARPLAQVCLEELSVPERKLIVRHCKADLFASEYGVCAHVPTMSCPAHARARFRRVSTGR